MNSSISHISNVLGSHGIRPSAQRIAVLGVLMQHRVHPNAEQILEMLLPQMPTLSLTTVYNTLRLLVQQDVVRMLGVDRRSARYDYSEMPHAHVWCRQCGELADVDTQLLPVAGGFNLHNYIIDEVDICYKGLCPRCAAAK
ncbi:MAG: transcriptional repressor [Muribaculum sp.]|nr:transcriptional repressor [Muribaculaceae bacterium]MCM1080825.1 transcriptional repressor [Muribaculum sp.]